MTEEPPIPEFADRLRSAMREASVTPGHLARAVSVAPTTVSRWLSGDRTPELPHLKLIARVLNTSVSYLVDDAMPILHVVEAERANDSRPLTNAQLADVAADILDQLLARLRDLPDP